VAEEKLIRDLIPDIVGREGRCLVVRVAERDELPHLLCAKLTEEVHEFLDSRQVEELADICEVVFALAHQAGVSAEELERLRAEKAAERGGFTKGIVLILEERA